MKKLLSSLGVLCAIAAIIGVVSLSPAPELTAEPYCTQTTCQGAFQRTAGPVTVTSNHDCMWAEMDAKAVLNSQIDCPFGFCDGPNYIITSPCTAQSAPYAVSMKATYKCAKCNGPFQQ